MGDFLTGVAVALGSIWFKDYLDNKNTFKMTTKQKAIEAYQLANSLIFALHPKIVMCKTLIKDKNMELFMKLSERYPTTALDDLEKLDVLIIENFYSLKSQLVNITILITEQLSFLMDIILTFPNLDITEIDFANKNKKYTSDIVHACQNLRDSLINEYINKATETSPNFFLLYIGNKAIHKKFFQKVEFVILNRMFLCEFKNKWY